MIPRVPGFADRALPVLFFLSLFCLFGSKTIGDPDLWLHLKHGEVILEQRGLPDKDPFAAEPSLPVRPGSLELSRGGYWLSQVLYYLVFQFSGFVGLHLLAASLYALIFIVQWRWMRDEGVGRSLLYLLISFGANIMLFNFPGERPQVFSFLFSLLAVFIIERFKKTGKGLIVLPVMFMVWANMHGGFIIGDVILLLYIIGEGVKRIAGREGLSGQQYRKLLVWSFAALAASMVNPNGFQAVVFLLNLKGSPVSREVIELKSPFVIVSELKLVEPMVFALVIAGLSAIAVLINLRRRDLSRALLSALVALGGLLVYRLLAFGVAVGIPLIGIGLWAALGPLRERPFWRAAGKYLGAAIVLLVLTRSVAMPALLVWEGIFFENDYDRSRFPARASDFVASNNIRGKIFSHFNWGSYLIWRLYPRYKTFIDGRGMSDEAYEIQRAILDGQNAEEGKPSWKELLDRFGMNILLIPPADIASGGIFPLVFALMDAEEWRLIYFDENAVIFVRKDEMNRELIRIYNMPKEFVYHTIIRYAERGMNMAPENAQFYVSMAVALRGLGRHGEAEQYLDRVKVMTPRIKGSEVGGAHK